MVIEVWDRSGRARRIGSEIARGGQATIYRVPEEVSLLAKIYPAPISGDTRAKLQWMIDHPLPESNGHLLISWPIELVSNVARQPVGFLMPRVSQTVTLLKVINPRMRQRELPRFNLRYLYRTARNLAIAVRAVHRNGYVIGDLNESNVLVNQNALVTIIDADSFQVDAGGTIFPCPVGKIEYTPPELQGTHLDQVVRTPTHDLFALAVIMFQLVMNGNHPFRSVWTGAGEPLSLGEKIQRGYFPYDTSGRFPVNRPPDAAPLSSLHPALESLFRTAFINGHATPATRPAEDAWIAALATAESALISCPRGHWYPGHVQGCPVCAREAAMDVAIKERAKRLPNPSPRRASIPANPLSGPSPFSPASLRTFSRRRFAKISAGLLGAFLLYDAYDRLNGTPGETTTTSPTFPPRAAGQMRTAVATQPPPRPTQSPPRPTRAASTNGVVIPSATHANPDVEFASDAAGPNVAINRPGYSYLFEVKTPRTPSEFEATLHVIPDQDGRGTFDLYFNRSDDGNAYQVIRIDTNAAFRYEEKPGSTDPPMLIATGQVKNVTIDGETAFTVIRTSQHITVSVNGLNPEEAVKNPRIPTSGRFAFGLTKNTSTLPDQAFSATFAGIEIKIL